ncbi:HEAT repeat-containing protein 4 [Phlyctochytrium planicorne]|nr:HEAT repeat-containing protein 4 [Phlyctochytrium planicorne]
MHGRYRDLLGDTEAAALAVPSIPRPHRKELLKNASDVYKIERQRRIRAALISSQHARKSTWEPIPFTAAIVKGVEFISMRPHENAVASAIDTPCVPKTNVRALRPRPRVPARLEAQLRALEPLEDRLDEERDVKPPLPFSVALKFDSEVAKCFEQWPFAIKERDDVFEEPVGLLPQENVKRRREASIVDAKSRLGGDVVVEGREWQQIAKLNNSERNVPYMLELWQRAEGVDLSELVPRQQVVEDVNDEYKEVMELIETTKSSLLEETKRLARNGKETNQKSQNKNEEEEADEGQRRTPSDSSRLPTLDEDHHSSPGEYKSGSSRGSSGRQKSPRTRSDSIMRHLLSEMGITSDSGTSGSGRTPASRPSSSSGSVALPPMPATTKKTLSDSTLRLLRKFAKEFPEENLTMTLRNTLTGAFIHDIVSVYTPQTNAYGKPIKIESKPKSLRKKRAYKLKADGGVSIALSYHQNQEGDFQLVIPEVDDDDEDNLSEFEPMNFRVPQEPAAQSQAPDGENNAPTTPQANSDGAMALKEQLGKMRTVLPPLPSRVNIKDEAEFNLKKLSSIIKRVVKREPPKKEENDQVPKTPTTPDLTIKSIWDIFDTPTINIIAPPMLGSPDYHNLQKTLLLCLHEDSGELRYEAAKMLIEIRGYWNLLRWDNIAFKNTLMEMLREGSSDESFLAGKTLCDMGVVDAKVLRRVRRGLGDLDETKRQAAKDTLSSLRSQHVTLLLEGLISESESTSWRVRVDVIELLEYVVAKHRPPREVSIDEDNPFSPTRNTSKDEFSSNDSLSGGQRSFAVAQPQEGSLDGIQELAASTMKLSMNELSRDDLSSLPASPQRTGTGPRLTVDSPAPPKRGLSPEKPHEGLRQHRPSMSNLRKQSMMLRSDNNLQRFEELKTKALLRQAIEVLLNLMWNDWCPEVRSAAGISLLNLGEGKSMFDWIISLLESSDPTKRIDALRCLAGLGFINGAALERYMESFQDPYASVRIEACKVACLISSASRDLINTLLNCLGDCDGRVRAYSVRAIGLSKCKEPRIREAFHWCLNHDLDPAVRIEAIKAAKDLNMVQENQYIRDSVLILYEMDKVEEVRKEAERSLIAAGVLSEVEGKMRGITTAALESAGGGQESKETPNQHFKPLGTALPHSQRQTATQSSSYQPRSEQGFRIATMTGQFPEPLSGHTQEEVDIYFRGSLVGEQEQQAVIDQVKEMAAAHRILQEVAQMEVDSPHLPDLGLDFDIHQPLKIERKRSKKKRISIGLK